MDPRRVAPQQDPPAGAAAWDGAAMASSPNAPTFVFDDLPLHWQMTRCEKYALAAVVAAAAPEVAIEVGTYRGGSLQVIAREAGKVYSIDTSAECRERLAGRFENVELLTGDSRQLLPALLERIAAARERLGLVLIDGGHSTAAVRADIDAILRYVPVRPLYVVLHDSFHPACRAGMLQADWTGCEHVHYVEVDFVPGVFHHQAFDTAKPRSMYGGLALALLLPERRRGELVVHRSQEGLFRTVLPRSRHSWTCRYWWLDRVRQWRHRLSRALRRRGVE